MRHLLLMTLLLGLLGRTSWGAEKTPTIAIQQTARLDLSLDKRAYERGEPIEVTVRLTNTGRKDTTLLEASGFTGGIFGLSVTVRGEDGKALPTPMKPYSSMGSFPGGNRVIHRGDSYTSKLLLNDQTPVLRSGTYSVTASYRGIDRAKRAIEKVGPDSPAQTFQITATPEAVIEARVARLVDQLNHGADAQRIAPLLGFTGSAETIAPLIDILYTDKGDQDAAEALLYLDHTSVRTALLASLKTRGPQEKMVYLLLVCLQTPPEEVVPLLLPALTAMDAKMRAAAVEGIRLSHPAKNAELLPLIIPLLKDVDSSVRMTTAATVGTYTKPQALDALKAAVADSDPYVREQATIAVGWIAQASKADSTLRKDAIDTLLQVKKSTGEAARQADYWLKQIKQAGTGPRR